ncbi:MFS transporter [Aeromicrobium sp. Root236]|uniref:MFS transporter n=1 Tax=Aeromicrobium sp. Root236 TaxID=1736498 RepID=UPI0006F21EFB|nr:MFS transporter [Aeromicrobium sp. Root236]KRC65970.1 MFS transporter [Aeromicrobium sp. Root236]
MTTHDTRNGTRVRTGPVLAVVSLALMTVVSAVSGLNVALPDLARETGATQTEITWIVDAYTVVFAGLLLFAGALGDRFGRRELLAAGLAVFGIAAGLGMLTSDPGQLIALRALMGMGAAAIMPTTLSIITTSFPVEQRGKAIGVWVGMAGGGAVLGLFGSGILLEFYSWSSFFGLNVALATLALLGTLVVVPSSVDEDPPRLDLVGALLSLVAVAGTVFGIIEGSDRGWGDALTLSGLAIGVLGLVGFVVWELLIDQPMLDPRLFRNRSFSAGSLTVMVQFFATFGLFFVVIQYLQFVVGRSPLEAAVALLPLPVVMIPLARNAPRIAHKVGFRRLAPLGLLFTASGLMVVSQVGADLTYWSFALGLVLFAAGMGLAGTPATTAITESLPESKQGVASAVNDTARELGSAFGIAILGSVLNQQYRDGMTEAVHGLPPAVAEGAESSIAFTQSPHVHEMGAAGQQLVSAAQHAFVDGIGGALLIAAAIVAVTAVVVAFLAPARQDSAV